MTYCFQKYIKDRELIYYIKNTGIQDSIRNYFIEPIKEAIRRGKYGI